jgi:hypothetical protein
MVPDNYSEVEARIAEAVTTKGSVTVLQGGAGYGKKFLVEKSVQEYNLIAPNPWSRRKTHVFTPGTLTDSKTQKRLVQFLHNKNVTGVVPVIVITQFYNLEHDFQVVLVEKLKLAEKYETKKQQKLARMRNPVVLLTDGNQDKYDTRVLRLLEPFVQLVLPRPPFKVKQLFAEQFFLENQADCPSNLTALVGGCRNFHVLKIQLNEVQHCRGELSYESDVRPSRENFFNRLRTLQNPKQTLYNAEVQLKLMGSSRSFALGVLQLNPPANMTVHQLWQYKNAYSELDTFALGLQEDLQGTSIKSALNGCYPVTGWQKLIFPEKSGDVTVTTSINSLILQYSLDSKKLVSRTEALERYSNMKSAYYDEEGKSYHREVFKPLQGVGDDLTVALNTKIRTSLLKWKTTVEPEKRKRQQQITKLFPNSNGLVPKRARPL